MARKTQTEPYLPSMVWYSLLASLVILIVIWLPDQILNTVTIPTEQFATIYVILEVLRISICIMIFAVRWASMDQGMDTRSTVISLAFLVVAAFFICRLVINLMTLSFTQADSSNEAILFRTAGRFSLAFFVLLASFLPDNNYIRTRTKETLLLAFIALFVVFTSIDVAFAESLPKLFENGPSNLMVIIGMISSAFFLVATVRYGRFAVRTGDSSSGMIAVAMAVGAPTEAAFLFVTGPASAYNLIGNSMGFMMFLLMFFALAFSSIRKPYAKLREANDALAEHKVELETMLEELNESHEAVRQTNTKLNLMNTIIRHDVKNQLQTLMGFMALLKEDGDEVDTDRYLDQAMAAVNRIRKQIDFTKVYQEIGTQSPEWHNVGKIVSKIASEMTDNKLEIRAELDGVEIYADRMIERVLYNLIHNTLVHGGKATKVRFSFTRLDGGSLAIIYEDDGVGVPAIMKDNIFERGVGAGTGMGMYLAREILSITDIMIVENGKEGEGARFEITVPKNRFKINGSSN